MTEEGRLIEVRRKVQAISDEYSRSGKFEPIEPGIFELVVALQYRGFNTIGSCEGHHKHYKPPVPWVMIMPNVYPTPPLNDEKLAEWNKELKALVDLAEQFRRIRSIKWGPYSDDEDILILVDDGATPTYPASVAPRAIQSLQALPRELFSQEAAGGMLVRYRNSMEHFAEFLIDTGRAMN